MSALDGFFGLTSMTVGNDTVDGAITAILESVTDGVILLDNEARYLYVNARAEALLQRAAPEILGQTVWEVFPTLIGTGFFEQYQRAVTTGAASSVDVYYEPLDIWAEVHCYPSAAGMAIYFRDISERKRAEAQLREREARLRTQYQAFPLPTYTWQHRDGDFVLIDYNVAANTFARGTLAAKVGQPASEIYRDFAEVREHLARCFAERGTLAHELRYFAPVAQVHRDLVVTYVYVAPDLVVMHSEEVTAQKAAEEALRASEARYRALMHHARDITLIIGEDGELRYLSPAVERVLGHHSPEVSRCDPFTLVHPDDRPAAERRFKEMLAQPGSAGTQELRVLRADGAWRWVEASASNLISDPDIRGIVVNYRDITERREAEAALRERDERFRLVARATNDAVWDWDLITDTLWWGEGVETLFGYATAGGRQQIDWWYERVHPEDHERVVGGVQAAIDRGDATWAAEYRFRRADGSYATVLDRGFVMRDERGVPARMLGSIQDITERKRAEEALRRNEAALAEAQRIAHLGSWEYDFVTGEVRWSDEVFRIAGHAPRSFSPTAELMMAQVHPDDRELVRAALAASRDRGEPFDLDHRIARPDGEVRLVHQQAELVRDADGRPLRRVGIVQDVTERRALEAQLQHETLHDRLTGLPNRMLFADRLEQAIARAGREGRACAVLLLDLDHFKTINDSLGHAVGDQLLLAVTARLRAALRGGDTLARLGGDEFAMLVEEVSDLAEAMRSAEQLHAAFRAPIVLDRRELVATASIGVALRSSPGDTPEDLLRFADVALYRAKEAGRARTEAFYPGMSAQALERLDLEQDLRHAVERGELRVHYQPKVDLASGRVAGLEALARWQHPERGLIMPGAFISLAEETGLIVPIGRWVLAEACRQLVAWQLAHPALPAPRLAVNLSARQFQHPDLLADVAAVIAQSGIAPRQLMLEVTESVAMQQAEAGVAILEALRALGVGLAIDDFGTGHSSLAYLQRLPVQTLKIDRSFFAGGDRNCAIVRAVTDLAHGLGLDVTAEGLETAEQVAWAREIGCDRGQGFYFSLPRPADGIEALWSAGLTFDLPGTTRCRSRGEARGAQRRLQTSSR
jgi:diguanylate cyclase (GGDEF)-like protein/PAS domain S-box-containing protein